MDQHRFFMPIRIQLSILIAEPTDPTPSLKYVGKSKKKVDFNASLLHCEIVLVKVIAVKFSIFWTVS
jgi:hypothetical protein